MLLYALEEGLLLLLEAFLALQTHFRPFPQEQSDSARGLSPLDLSSFFKDDSDLLRFAQLQFAW